MTTNKTRAYPITVEYTIEYNYSWTESETTCSTNSEGRELAVQEPGQKEGQLQRVVAKKQL